MNNRQPESFLALAAIASVITSYSIHYTKLYDINAAYRRLGIDTKTELTGHGWRAVARTMLHERLKFPVEVIEHQLAHAVPDALGRAYNRTRFLEERKAMMQAWADYLDRQKASYNFV